MINNQLTQTQRFFLMKFKTFFFGRMLLFLKSLHLSLQWAIPFMILIVSIESHLIISYLVSVAAGVSVAAAFLLPWLVPPNSSVNFWILSSCYYPC